MLNHYEHLRCSTGKRITVAAATQACFLTGSANSELIGPTSAILTPDSAGRGCNRQCQPTSPCHRHIQASGGAAKGLPAMQLQHSLQSGPCRPPRCVKLHAKSPAPAAKLTVHPWPASSPGPNTDGSTSKESVSVGTGWVDASVSNAEKPGRNKPPQQKTARSQQPGGTGPGRSNDTNGSSTPSRHQDGKDSRNAARTPWQQQVASGLQGSSNTGKARPKQATKPKRLSADQALQRKKGCCYGCGAKLQTEAALGPGYVPPQKFELKAKHKQLDKVLCDRCSELCNGAMIPAVEDFTQKLQAQVLRDRESVSDSDLQLLGKSLITPEQLRQQLSEVATARAVVVLLVDLTDASGTLMARVRDMIGRNPIVLVGTKMDLMPEGTHPRDVADWLQDAAARKALNVVSCHLVSSHTGEGMSVAIGKIVRERKGRDVYVVGAANVGKSAFVRAMLKEMAKFEGGNFDAAALANGRYLPVESPMPGTTLGFIPLRAFESGGTLYDTPGVHLHHRVPHMLSPEELKLLHPRKRLLAIIPAMPVSFAQTDTEQADVGTDDKDKSNEDQRGSEAQPGFDWTGEERLEPTSKKRRPKVPAAGQVKATYTWSDLARVDVLSAPATTALAFYGPSSMRVAACALQPAPTQPTADNGASASGNAAAPAAAATASTADGSTAASGRVLRCAQSVAARGGLVPHRLTVRVDGSRGPLADLAISGVPGWVSIWAPNGRQDVQLRVWAPRGVEVFLRPPLPCQSPFRAGSWDAADDEGDDELGLDASSLQALAAEYEGGGAASNINDAAWWEAAFAEVEAFEAEEAEEGEADEGEKVIPQRGSRWNRRLNRAARPGGERIIMQATVEDILKRPRLEDVFGGMDDEDDEQDVEDVEGEDDEEEAGPSRPTRSQRSPRAFGRPVVGLRGRRGLARSKSKDERE